jgi:hypothetical protein
MWGGGLLLDKYQNNPISFIVDSTLIEINKLIIYTIVMDHAVVLTVFFNLI